MDPPERYKKVKTGLKEGMKDRSSAGADCSAPYGTGAKLAAGALRGHLIKFVHRPYQTAISMPFMISLFCVIMPIALRDYDLKTS